MKKISFTFLLASILCCGVAQAEDKNESLANENTEADVILVVTTRATSVDMFPVNLDEGKFGKKPINFHHIGKRSPTISGLFRQKNHFKQANKEDFFIRYIPAGKYAYVSSIYVQKQRSSIRTIVDCKADGGSVFNLEGGNIYYFSAPDKFINQKVAEYVTSKKVSGRTLNEEEARTYLNTYLGEKLERKVDVIIPEEIGKVTFIGDKRSSLGSFGNEVIRCPDGKDFTYTPK